MDSTFKNPPQLFRFSYSVVRLFEREHLITYIGKLYIGTFFIG